MGQNCGMSQTLFALVLFLIPLAYSPGPGNLLFAANGARFGFRATLPLNAGYHLATWVVTFAIGLGFFAVLERAPGATLALKWAGGIYVLRLAWSMIRAGATSGTMAPKPAGFYDGAVLLLLYPKAYLTIALMYAHFPIAQGFHAIVWVSVVTTVFTLNNLLAFTLWTLSGDRLGRVFAAPGHAQRMNLVFGSVLAGVAVWMLTTSL